MSEVEAFERCLAAGGLAVFPADTVYGLACDPEDRCALERLYLLKRRDRRKPSAVMYFDLELALSALPEIGRRSREAMRRLLPGAVTVLLGNPEGRFPLACGNDHATLGLRVPLVPSLAGMRGPVLQSSANFAGGPDPRRVSDVPALIRAAADLVIDAGELPGTPSTVVDLRRYDDDGAWEVVRPGAVAVSELERALAWPFHFDPTSYPSLIRAEIPLFERLQEEVADATTRSTCGARRILELGTGTGETAKRMLARHPEAVLVGIDESESMLASARRRLPPGRVELRVARLQQPLPAGPFDLVASALCVHHLDAPGKADLFARVRSLLTPGGMFVLGDVVVPDDPADARTELTPGYDQPSSVSDQLRWLDAVGFGAGLVWSRGDLAVIAATAARV